MEGTATPTSSGTLLQNFISDNQLLHELKISGRTLRRLRLKAKLPAVRLGNTMYYSRTAVQDWLNELAAVRAGRKGSQSVRRAERRRRRVVA